MRRKSEANGSSLAKFPRHPILHVRLQGVEVHVQTRFQLAVPGGESVVKRAAPGKTPHAKAIEPGKRTRIAPGFAERFYSDFSREHQASLNAGSQPLPKLHHFFFRWPGEMG